MNMFNVNGLHISDDDHMDSMRLRNPHAAAELGTFLNSTDSKFSAAAHF